VRASVGGDGHRAGRRVRRRCHAVVDLGRRRRRLAHRETLLRGFERQVLLHPGHRRCALWPGRPYSVQEPDWQLWDFDGVCRACGRQAELALRPVLPGELADHAVPGHRELLADEPQVVVRRPVRALDDVGHLELELRVGLLHLERDGNGEPVRLVLSHPGVELALGLLDLLVRALPLGLLLAAPGQHLGELGGQRVVHRGHARGIGGRRGEGLGERFPRLPGHRPEQLDARLLDGVGVGELVEPQPQCVQSLPELLGAGVGRPRVTLGDHVDAVHGCRTTCRNPHRLDRQFLRQPADDDPLRARVEARAATPGDPRAVRVDGHCHDLGLHSDQATRGGGYPGAGQTR
jgi:hypothetical protein